MFFTRDEDKEVRSIAIRRGISVVLTAIFIVSVFMSGSFAWSVMTQSALNEAQGAGHGFKVQLTKYEKLKDGTTTRDPISGAAFYLYTSSGDQIGGRYVTNKDGVIDARLKPGNYYFEETNPSYGWTYDTDNKGDNITRYPFTVHENEPSTVTITAYNRRIEGSLTITKTVRNSDGSALTQAQTDQYFTFAVTFSDGGSYEYKINDGPTQTLISGGAFQLSHGDSAVFSHVAVGTGYIVTETAAEGYVTSSDNSSGDITASGVTAAFVNTHSVAPPTDEYGNLVVTKEVTGDAADTDKQFEFNAVIGNDNQTFTLKSGESKAFADIPVGTSYTITESDYSADGYTATVSEYRGAISVKGTTITLPFVNTHEVPLTETGNLAITKLVTGEGADPAKAFDFTVMFYGPGAPTPATQTFTLKSGETKTFSGIPAGVSYQVVEAAASGYSANFSSANGTIPANGTATVGFVNTYHISPPPEKTALTIEKIGEGEGFDANKEFSFTVFINGHSLSDRVVLKAGQKSQPIELNVGDSYAVVEDNYTADGYARTALVNGAGTATADALTVTQTNTYVGPVLITLSGEKTWDLQDQTAHLPSSITVRLKKGDIVVASVVVKPDDTGAWKYSFIASKYDAQGAEIAYTVDEVQVAGWKAVYNGMNIKNISITPVTDTPITVQKTVTGAPAEPSAFKFMLTSLDGAPLPDGAIDAVKTVTINGAGSADFGAITYSAAGTYRYTVAELNTGVNGYTYDESVYTVTVTVVEQDGVLSIANKTLTKNGQEEEAAQFVNTYEADKTSLKVTKAWGDNNDPNRPTSVQVQLYKGQTAFGGPVTLNANNNWTHIYTGLDKSAQWSVDELQTPQNYLKTITGDAANGYTITNTLKGFTPPNQTITISGKKIWYQGSNPDNKRPTSIVVILKANGVITLQKQVTAEDYWSWKFTVQKYDDNGHEVNYSIDEARIENYTKKISGYDITNTYTPGHSTDDNPGTYTPGGGGGGSGAQGGAKYSPKTGDYSNFTLWLSLLIASSVGLVVMGVFWRKHKTQYQPKH